ncbi:hypothetical protein [Frateuria sp. STR12]|uniref:hypothetical protein n=1 Tax=Frateuria hangzhouensis TaxID=2995589 RepID=UPI002260B2C9|nr:hypothetical protein [Frateuria sp. STR12]MCX7514142.1 hypothetical protein [Frateuria sp. STR12]
MHYDESLPASRQSLAGGTVHSGIKLPATTPAKSPGGVPPMFAARGDAQPSPVGSPGRAQDS